MNLLKIHLIKKCNFWFFPCAFLSNMLQNLIHILACWICASARRVCVSPLASFCAASMHIWTGAPTISTLDLDFIVCRPFYAAPPPEREKILTEALRSRLSRFVFVAGPHFQYMYTTRVEVMALATGAQNKSPFNAHARACENRLPIILCVRFVPVNLSLGCWSPRQFAHVRRDRRIKIPDQSRTRDRRLVWPSE